MRQFDLVIIGAGPAGMAAAALASEAGASVALLDEQSRPGGQIYRNVTVSTPRQLEILGADYSIGRRLTDNLFKGAMTYISSATVWSVTPEGKVTFTAKGETDQVEGRHLLLATGALERPVPIAGWTTPGVMTAGAAQILLKTSGLINKHAVLAGSGPLLYLLAAQMTAAGAPPRALVETQTWASHIKALRYFRGAITGRKAIFKGLGLLLKLRRAGVKRYTGVKGIEVLGENQVSGLRITKSGQAIDLSCDSVFLHQGVVPNTQMTRALGLEHAWNADQQCFHPVTNEWGRTSNAAISIAGDGAGIGGANAAEHAGRLCAVDILHELGRLDARSRDSLAAPIAKALKKERAVRPFLDTLYTVPDFIRRPDDAVLICRCEEVTAGDIRNYARLGCQGPNQTKAFGRSGMGPCQGRYCGLTVTEILAAEHDASEDAIGSYRIRMPIKPVTLGEIASFSKTSSAGAAPESETPEPVSKAS